jgi:hypothetical protein
MKELHSPPRLRGASLVGAALAVLSLAAPATASSVSGAGAPAASAVHARPAQPAPLQADESASLLRGVVEAVDDRGSRVQVQGIWLDLVAGQTRLLRQGRSARFETLKAGEAIRFTVAPASTGARAMKVIYAP